LAWLVALLTVMDLHRARSMEESKQVAVSVAV
jgi:hypothetical protein